MSQGNGNAGRSLAATDTVTFDELIGFANSITETIKSTMTQNEETLKDQLLLINNSYEGMVKLIEDIDKEIDRLLNTSTSTKAEHDRVQKELKDMNDKRKEVKDAITAINEAYADKIGTLTNTNNDFIRIVKGKNNDLNTKLTDMFKKINGQTSSTSVAATTGGKRLKRRTHKGGYVWGKHSKGKSMKKGSKKHSKSKSSKRHSKKYSKSKSK
jgi:septal ring factor EnvC (AmiA/AmiB activator)